MKPKTTVIVTQPFEAARHMGTFPEGHRSRALHGHSFLASLRCAVPDGFTTYPGGEIETIKARLQPHIKKLDYSLLNDHVEVPTDDNIARWIDTQCDVPGTQSVSVQSTVDEGVEIDHHGVVHVWRRYYFQAAHRLPHVAAGHKCGNMHGHGFAVVLQTSHHAGDGDLRIHYDLLDTHWNMVFESLDHACLNNIPGLENPTSEIISQWIWNQLKAIFIELSAVTVYETASCGASYNGQNIRIWKEFTLDSAVIHKKAPMDNKRSRLHGYTYTLRLHLSAPLDEVMGWAVDFGDVKERFNPLFKQLDHNPLYEITDLPGTDVANLSRWILDKARISQPEVYRVDIYETKGCGAISHVGASGPILPL